MTRGNRGYGGYRGWGGHRGGHGGWGGPRGAPYGYRGYAYPVYGAYPSPPVWNSSYIDPYCNNLAYPLNSSVPGPYLRSYISGGYPY